MLHPIADDDISAALEVERLSADDTIDMLSSDPDRFFGRTTKVRGMVRRGSRVRAVCSGDRVQCSCRGWAIIAFYLCVQTLEVQVESAVQATTESRPSGPNTGL